MTTRTRPEAPLFFVLAGAVVLGAAVLDAPRLTADDASWTRWEYVEADQLASGPRVFVFSQVEGSGQFGPSAFLICDEDGQRVQLRDGLEHGVPVGAPAFRFDDGDSVEVYDHRSSVYGATFSWAQAPGRPRESFDELFAVGLRKSFVLRYRLGDGPEVVAPLRGSTAAMAKYDDACRALVTPPY